VVVRDKSALQGVLRCTDDGGSARIDSSVGSAGTNGERVC
jgi:hypothetical protein